VPQTTVYLPGGTPCLERAVGLADRKYGCSSHRCTTSSGVLIALHRNQNPERETPDRQRHSPESGSAQDCSWLRVNVAESDRCS
jgi:hypothetical protein